MNLPYLVRSSIVLVSAASFHWSLTPPNPPPAKNEIISRGLFEKSIRIRAALDRTFVWVTAILDIANSYSLLQQSRAPERPAATSMPLMFCIGAVICLVGNLWRNWAFAALGKLFDFEFRIQKNHQLITSGPYAYVRHPSYTGLFALYIGASMIVFTPGHWFREFGFSSFAGILGGIYWCSEVTITTTYLARRMKAEDDGLRRAFGQQWDEYARKVSHCLIPGIY